MKKTERTAAADPPEPHSGDPKGWDDVWRLLAFEPPHCTVFGLLIDSRGLDCLLTKLTEQNDCSGSFNWHPGFPPPPPHNDEAQEFFLMLLAHLYSPGEIFISLAE